MSATPTTIPGANLGQPPVPVGTTFDRARVIGVVEISDMVYAFVLVQLNDGSDSGNTKLWCRTLINGVWRDWVPLGMPATGIDFDGSGQGTVIAGPAGIFVFVAGGKDDVYCCWWNGAAWQWVDIGAPTGQKVNFIDNVLASPFGVSVQAADGTCWFSAFNPAGWTWGPIPNATFFKRTNSILPLSPDGQFYMYFQIDQSGNLLCEALVFTGISTDAHVYVDVKYDGIGAFDGNFPPTVYVRGINPDGTHVQSSRDQNGRFDLSRESAFKSGAVCWLYATGGKASYVVDVTVDDDESAANFNYAPMGGNQAVMYSLSQKTAKGRVFGTFSGCSNVPAS